MPAADALKQQDRWESVVEPGQLPTSFMRAAQRRQVSLVFGWSSMPDYWRSRVPARNREIRTPRVGSGWLHEIKHDGYRRDPVGIRLITRRGNDWTQRYPLVVEAVNHLKVRSCLIDGEVVCCDAQGVTSFQLLRHRRNEAQAFL